MTPTPSVATSAVSSPRLSAPAGTRTHTWATPTYRLASELDLWHELNEARTRCEDLSSQLHAFSLERDLTIAHAALSEIGLFLLTKLAQADGALSLDHLAENISGPQPWIAVARLMKAGLVDDNGRCLYLTSLAEELLAELSTE